jgi:hypothetical protein
MPTYLSNTLLLRPLGLRLMRMEFNRVHPRFFCHVNKSILKHDPKFAPLFQLACDFSVSLKPHVGLQSPGSLPMSLNNL